ncbi:unnamed protein product [Diplocarpon coronariae]
MYRSCGASVSALPVHQSQLRRRRPIPRSHCCHPVGSQPSRHRTTPIHHPAREDPPTRRHAPDAAAEALRKLCGSSAASASFHRASFSPSPRGLLPVWRCRGDSNPLDKSDGRRVSLPLGC